MVLVDDTFFKQRTKYYLHFDKKLTPAKLAEYITNPDNISTHAFLPFIAYTHTDTKLHKPNGIIEYKEKKRPISYPSHLDGQIYGYYAYLLSQPYEQLLNQYQLQTNVTAFRKISATIDGKTIAKCNIHFAKDVFDVIRDKQNCVVLCYDISGFFDNLNHQLLKQAWCDLLDVERLPTDHFKVYNSLTQFAYVDKVKLYQTLGLSLNSRTLHKRYQSLCTPQDFRQKIRNGNLITKNLKPKGIPQGSPISGILSNIYMLSFDKAMKQLVGESGQYFRYCDDMIFIINKNQETKITKKIEQAIEQLKLTINDKKTQRVEFVDGKVSFDPNDISFNRPAKLSYLGLNFDGQNVFLRDSGIARYHKKMRLAVRMHKRRFQKLQSKQQIQGDKMYRKALYERFTYIGKSNYLSYVFRVAGVHDSKVIKQQVRGHWRKMHNHLS